MMLLGDNFPKTIFYANSLNPDQTRHDNVRPHSAFTPCADPNAEGGGGVQMTPSKISQNIVSLVTGPTLEKSHSYQATFLCMANIDTLAKSHLNGVSLAGR